MKRFIFIVPLLVSLYMTYTITGWCMMSIITRGGAEFSATVRDNPNILNGMTISGKDLSAYQPDGSDGVVLENLTIRGLKMKDVDIRRIILRNVTFIDCTFVRTVLAGTLENVRFIGGEMSGYNPPKYLSDSWDYETVIGGRFGPLLFDGVYFGNSVSLGMRDGLVVMRNITTREKALVNESASLLHGSNIRVRMDNCRIYDQYALNLSEGKNTIYITNSTFTKADLNASGGTVAWIENCTVYGGLPATDTLVVTNCRVTRGSVGGGEKGTRVFLVNNSYRAAKGVIATDEASLRIFADADNPDNSWLYLYSGKENMLPGVTRLEAGHINVFDAEIAEVVQYQADIKSLNLSNVTIRSANWEGARVGQGLWNDVRLYPPQDLKGSRFGSITGYHVEYPEGTPWVNGKPEIINSPTPLNIERPPVPTLEELGLAQFWRENDFPPVER